MLIIKYVLLITMFFYIALYIVAFLNYKVSFKIENIVFVLILPIMFYINNKSLIQFVKKDIESKNMSVSEKTLNKLFRKLMLSSMHIFIPDYFQFIKTIENRQKNTKKDIYKNKKLRDIPNYKKELENRIKYA